MQINTSQSYLLKSISSSVTDSSIKDITSPKGILEHIINFITFGKIRKYKEFFHNELIKNIEKSFNEVTEKEIKDGRKIHLDDINGCKVSFCCKGYTNKVTVEVKKNYKSESQEIDLAKFLNTFQALKLKPLLNITCIKDILTDDGFINLSGADLSGADLSGANLSGANLSGANLSGADLSGANLSGADLSGANLSGADLTKAALAYAKSEPNLRGADLTKATLAYANMFSVDLTNANLSDANLSYAILTCANLTNANLSDTDLSYATLIGVNLTNTNLNNSKQTTIKWKTKDITS